MKSAAETVAKISGNLSNFSNQWLKQQRNQDEIVVEEEGRGAGRRKEVEGYNHRRWWWTGWSSTKSTMRFGFETWMNAVWLAVGEGKGGLWQFGSIEGEEGKPAREGSLGVGDIRFGEVKPVKEDLEKTSEKDWVIKGRCSLCLMGHPLLEVGLGCSSVVVWGVRKQGGRREGRVSEKEGEGRANGLVGRRSRRPK